MNFKKGDPNRYMTLQLGVVAGSEVALGQMSLKAGGEGGLIVNTASLAGVSRSRTNTRIMWNLSIPRLYTGSTGTCPAIL